MYHLHHICVFICSDLQTGGITSSKLINFGRGGVFNVFCLFVCLFILLEMESHYGAQANRELLMLLPHSSEFWDYRCILPPQ